MKSLDSNKLLLYWSNEIAEDERAFIEKGIEASPENASFLTDLSLLKSEIEELPQFTSNIDFVGEALEKRAKASKWLIPAIFGPRSMSLAVAAFALVLFLISTPEVEQTALVEQPAEITELDYSFEEIHQRISSSRKRLAALRRPRRHMRLASYKPHSRNLRARNTRRRISRLRNKLLTTSKRGLERTSI
jgi:hypothetical protein